MDGSSLESDSDLRRHSVVLLRAGSKQDQINKERPRPPVLFSSIVGEEEHDSVGINRDLTGLNYISGLAFFVLRSVDNTNCTMAPEVIRAGSHLPPTQPPRAAPRMGLDLSLRLGNRSSRGSSGSISDFDELAITAGIIPSLK
ncbi:hypothetical protein HaLaN_28905 [Haematococcus lacustris]|uniref:Uncharacterized protein n=1 Tax=Haematococcus lacustris TaxID=44745 RepID=A0A6A0ADE2_HAELA|nr:hypothetical protein HaLaN_28905 [Haematococcus lacustris]